MEFSIIGLWHAAGPIPKGVIVLLLALSVYTLAIMIERGMILRNARNASAGFSDLTDQGQLTVAQTLEAAAAPERGKYCFLAQIVQAGLEESNLLAKEGQRPAVILEAAQDTVTRAVVVTTGTMRRRLVMLATVSSGAPFIGLFGTIMGLIRSFQSIAVTESGGIAAVSGGIAEALITTMVGIGVAIPALFAYNYFADRIDAFAVELDNKAVQIVEHLLRREFVIDDK